MDACPGCETTHFRLVTDLPEYLGLGDGGDRVTVLTKLSLHEIMNSGLAAKAGSQGAEIVVRQGEDSLDEIARHGWLSLPSPFSWDDLSELVQVLNLSTTPRRLA